jgi:AcrR family transcriptional regulator
MVGSGTSETPAQPCSPARERILDAAFRLFYARGPRGVGVDTVIEESAVAKATLYKYFRHKDDLVVAYLEKVDEAWSAQLHAAADAAGDEPAAQLVGMFDAVAHALRNDGYHGCAFINTAAESEPGSVVHQRTVAHKRAVRAWVTDLCRRAGAVDPDALGRQLTVLIDGALSEGVLDADKDTVSAAKAAAAALVEVACRRRE